MMRGHLKHILVFICLFTLLEKSGISLASFFFQDSAALTITDSDAQDDESARRGETKEGDVKEFFAVEPQVKLFSPHLHSKSITFADFNVDDRLTWIPPVPTPPPNNLPF